MKLRWTARASQDLKEIGHYIAEDNKIAARNWVERIRKQAQNICQTPFAGRVVSELGQEDIREIVFGNYRIVYRVSKEVLEVLTVFEGHRLFRSDEIGK